MNSLIENQEECVNSLVCLAVLVHFYQRDVFIEKNKLFSRITHSVPMFPFISMLSSILQCEICSKLTKKTQEKRQMKRFEKIVKILLERYQMDLFAKVVDV